MVNRFKDEQGAVSLLTVIFFMIFISIIAVGFTTIVVADQRQAVDNDLAASALSAARNGVEDGKRILLYCNNNPSAVGCSDVLDKESCNVLGSGNGKILANALGIVSNASGEGVSGGAPEYQQHFTCLRINKKTDDIEAPLNSTTDYVQRLKTEQAFQSLEVAWRIDSGGLLQNGSHISSTGWPNVTAWNSSKRFPVLQLQIIPFVEADFADLNILEKNTRTLFLVPCATGNTPCVGKAPNIGSDARSDINHRGIGSEPIVYAVCDPVKSSCSTTIGGFNGGDAGGTQYYARISLLYADSAILTLKAKSSSDSLVKFDDVQPAIDSTGRTNDVFKRVKTRVSYNSNYISANALSSAAPICKVMTVTNDGSSSSYDCD